MREERTSETGDAVAKKSTRASVRAQLAKLQSGQNQGGMIGTPEFLALAASGLLLLTAVFAYFFFLVPARVRLEASARERARLQAVIRAATADGAQANANPQASVAEIQTSLRIFEADGLGARSGGSEQLVSNLNRLVQSNGLRAGTFSFTSINPADRAGTSASLTRTAAERQAIFPSVNVSLTVEGAYANLRRFIRDIEASQQFVIINDVELEGVTESRGGTASGARSAGARGTLVGLRLEISAYFQRAENVGQPAQGATR